VLFSIGLLLFGTTGAVLDLLPPVTVFVALLWGLINLVFSVGLFRVQRGLSHRRQEQPSSHEESPHVSRSSQA
jgi:cytochrome c-type biogenesis protein CcmH/NrfF